MFVSIQPVCLLVGAASDQLLCCPRPCSAWICIFFSAGQVLLSTLSWCSACTPVSEGVFLMHLCRETYSTSPTLVFSWPLFFIHSYGFELLSSVWTVILKDPLYISYEARLQGINSLDYCLSTKVLIWGSLKKLFLYIAFLVEIFHVGLNSVIPISLAPSLWCEICFSPCWRSIVHDKPLLSCSFNRFLFCSVFQQFD